MTRRAAVLNDELARIMIAERVRMTNEHVRQGRLRQVLAERKAAAMEQRGTGTSAAAEPCLEANQQARPALG
jgi:hypothetical protein